MGLLAPRGMASARESSTGGPGYRRARLRVTDVQITSAAGTYIALEQGYFEAEGIDIELIRVAPGDQVPALIVGSVDVIGAAINAALFNALARNLPLRLVADHGTNLPNASASGWVVRKDLVDSGRYRRPSDAVGWRVGVGTPNSTLDIALDKFLRTGGLSIDDVKMVLMPYAEMLAAFANKALEAAWFQEPFTTIAVERGLVWRGPLAGEVYPGQQIAVVVFGKRLIDDRELAVRYLRAYVRGVRDYVRGVIEKDPELFGKVVPILARYTTMKDPELFRKAVPSGLKRDPVPNLESMEADLEWMLARGWVERRFRLRDFVDLGFIQEALRQLGP